MINIKGLDKAELLVELYNHSHQQGMGMLQPARNLTVEDARKLLEQSKSFDYLYGKVMKIDLSNDEQFEEWLYDRDNGQGMAQSVVDGMRKKMEEAPAKKDEFLDPKQELINYGFGKQNSERISLYFQNINDKDYVSAIRENNSFLEQLGFSKDEVIRLAKSIYSFYDLDRKYIQGKIDEITSLGVTKEEAINLCKTTRIFGTVGSTKEHMEDVISLGYSKDECLDMLKNDYELYLSLGVSKNDWNDLFRKLSLLGYSKNELLEMIKNREINYLNLFEYNTVLENMEFAQTTISKLLSSGKTKSEALNECNKIYRALKQEEYQRNYDESKLPNKGMSK